MPVGLTVFLSKPPQSRTVDTYTLLKDSVCGPALAHVVSSLICWSLVDSLVLTLLSQHIRVRAVWGRGGQLVCPVLGFLSLLKDLASREGPLLHLPVLPGGLEVQKSTFPTPNTVEVFSAIRVLYCLPSPSKRFREQKAQSWVRCQISHEQKKQSPWTNQGLSLESVQGL